MTQPQGKTRVKLPTKPGVPVIPKPQIPSFNKPFFNNKQRSFSTAFRTQSKGGGGK